MDFECEEVQPDGTRIKWVMADGQLYQTKTYDRKPILDALAVTRQANQGKSWGDGAFIGHIPGPVFGQMLKDGSINDQKAILRFFDENPLLKSR